MDKDSLSAKNSSQPLQPLIRTRGLTKIYQTTAGDFPALKSVDLDVYAGELLTVIGKSGAGKTTLINLITGVDHITSGEVWFRDTAIHSMNEEQLTTWRGHNLGMIYQSFYLMPGLNLINNVLLPIDFSGNFRSGPSKERALELLRMVELEEHAYKYPSEISGGQQQRVAIARALANDPPLIVADEPTGRLDSATAEVIFNIFENLVKFGKTIFMVTHDTNFANRSTRTLKIADGQILNS
ncbi:MAG: ABC transporter ATP-binding protein [Chloroflexi bacterium]|nr:ABC transporter ATP-binding protein [Chloroflexota bacterium]